MWSALSNLFILPFLLVISIPLALSAAITTCLALTTLFLRALAVYFELSFALLANFFLFPAHSPASVPFLALSGATTPAVDRPPSRAKHTHHYYQANAQQHQSNTKAWHTKEVVVEDYFFHHNHNHNHNHPVGPKPPPVATKNRPVWNNADNVKQRGPALLPSHEVLSSFVSGNSERDFEGVGGWRTPLASRKKHHHAPSASSASYHSSEEEEMNDEEEDDDQAWVSINRRLELPSRHLNLASANTSPVMPTAATVESQQQQQRPRFHRRSVTTPLFSRPSPTSNSFFSTEQTVASTQLQPSKSSAVLESLPSSSPPSFPRPSTSHAHPLSWQDAPFLMTPTGFGTDYKMVHYPSFMSRRRRSSASSSAKAMSLTGLGLT